MKYNFVLLPGRRILFLAGMEVSVKAINDDFKCRMIRAGRKGRYTQSGNLSQWRLKQVPKGQTRATTSLSAL